MKKYIYLLVPIFLTAGCGETVFSESYDEPSEDNYEVVSDPFWMPDCDDLCTAEMIDRHNACLKFEAFGPIDHIDMSGEDLQNVDCRRLDLSHVNYARADLRSANFAHADLSHADFSDANLKGADFTGADIGQADFRGAKLEGVVWDRAELSHTIFDLDDPHSPFVVAWDADDDEDTEFDTDPVGADDAIDDDDEGDDEEAEGEGEEAERDDDGGDGSDEL